METALRPHFRKTLQMLAVYLFILLSACTESGKSDYQKSLSEVLRNQSIAPSEVEIHIDKSDYQLTVKHEGQTIRTYPIVLGFNPEDDKRMEGDGCTPEGTFYIRTKYAHKNWSRFIWVDYPNEDSWRKHNRSKANGEIPSDATIGGEIGIHGVPKGKDDLIDEGNNWTLGCISLKNKDIKDIYPIVTNETKIIITK